MRNPWYNPQSLTKNLHRQGLAVTVNAGIKQSKIHPMSSPRVILTGASRGLGLAVLKLLLERYNARVATLSRSYPAELRAVVDRYGADRVICVQGDISKPEDNQKVVKSAVDAWGGLDSLILNASSVDPFGRF